MQNCFNRTKILRPQIYQRWNLPRRFTQYCYKNIPRPNNIKDLERFLGLITYVSNFVPNFSVKTSILRELLKTNRMVLE